MIQLEFDNAYLRQRIWQIVPGLLSWGTLIGLTVLAFIAPFWIAIFVITYDVYILFRIVYMTVHLLYAYRQLKKHRKVDWLARCQEIEGWEQVHHFIVVPTYDESLEILKTTIHSVLNTTFPREKMHVVVGFEERAGREAQEKAEALKAEF